MDRQDSDGRSWLLKELASAQGDLVGDMVQALRRVRAARVALQAATAAGTGPDTVCFTDEQGRPFTVEQLRELVHDLEAAVGDSAGDSGETADNVEPGPAAGGDMPGEQGGH